MADNVTAVTTDGNLTTRGSLRTRWTRTNLAPERTDNYGFVTSGLISSTCLSPMTGVGLWHGRLLLDDQAFSERPAKMSFTKIALATGSWDPSRMSGPSCLRGWLLDPIEPTKILEKEETMATDSG